MIKLLREKLQGRKVYITVSLSTITAIVGYILGDVSLKELVGVCFLCLTVWFSKTGLNRTENTIKENIEIIKNTPEIIEEIKKEAKKKLDQATDSIIGRSGN